MISSFVFLKKITSYTNWFTVIHDIELDILSRARKEGSTKNNSAKSRYSNRSIVKRQVLHASTSDRVYLIERENISKKCSFYDWKGS